VQPNRAGEQKLCRLFGHFKIVLLLSVLVCTLGAKSFSEFKRTKSSQKVVYQSQDDAKFNERLLSDWQSYLKQKPKYFYKKKKPEHINPARVKNIDKIGPRVTIVVSKDKIITPNLKFKKQDIEFDFFGTYISFGISQDIKEANFFPLSQVRIKNFYDSLHKSNYDIIIEKIKNISKELNLNDWGRYLLVKKISELIYEKQDNSKLFISFIFNKMGYSMRVGISKKHIVLIFASDNIVYETPYFIIGEQNFYILSEFSNNFEDSIVTYKNNYPKADKLFDFSIKSMPTFERNIKYKTINFKISGKKYKIDYRYNKNLIDFLSTYPQVSYDIYFNAPMDEMSKEDISIAMKKYIDNKHANVAINFILNFVQNGFEYQVDEQQFGGQKVMFADETLYFDKSDCEDRATLFSKLIKDLIKINVIGVKYKDHISTALYVPIDGDSVNYYSKKYLIADPTYKNAIVGQNMPKYKSLKPEGFITIK
jgi:hypothetical protein